MILQSLAKYYDRLVSTDVSGVPELGFSTEKVHFSLVLSEGGELVQVFDLRQQSGKRLVPRAAIVPQGPKRSVNIAPSFLWGSTSYVLGADEKGKPDRTAQCHQAFREHHEELLKDVDDKGARAVLAFLDHWNPEDAPHLEHWQDMLKGNLVFQLDGATGFVHERPLIKQVWKRAYEAGGDSPVATCLVTGQEASIAKLHPAIRGVSNAQSSGASLVSFNLDSFCSYGKTQSFNAPVGEESAFAYTTSLNYLLRPDSPNRLPIGDATTVFWTERDSPVEALFGQVMNPGDSAADNKELRVFLESVRQGRRPPNIEDWDVRFYVLGLSPNASRLAVRFWYAGTVGEVADNLGQHFRDLEMVTSRDEDPEYPALWQLLREARNRKSKDDAPPLLAGAFAKAVIGGTLYPQGLLAAVINRIRAEQAARSNNDRPIPNVNYLRAALIKAILVRKARILNHNLEVPVALDKNNKNEAYLLGRLFAALEKAQRDANPGINATIKDRFYGSASTAPRAVFPQLLRLAQHHIAKAEYGYANDQRIEEILNDLRQFPAHLPLDQQGMFAIGYYQQRQDFFKGKQKETKTTASTEEK